MKVMPSRVKIVIEVLPPIRLPIIKSMENAIVVSRAMLSKLARQVFSMSSSKIGGAAQRPIFSLIFLPQCTLIQDVIGIFSVFWGDLTNFPNDTRVK